MPSVLHTSAGAWALGALPPLPRAPGAVVLPRGVRGAREVSVCGLWHRLEPPLQAFFTLAVLWVCFSVLILLS